MENQESQASVILLLNSRQFLKNQYRISGTLKEFEQSLVKKKIIRKPEDD